jgi:hypothetical protein
MNIFKTLNKEYMFKIGVSRLIGIQANVTYYTLYPLCKS